MGGGEGWKKSSGLRKSMENKAPERTVNKQMTQEQTGVGGGMEGWRGKRWRLGLETFFV